MKNVKLLKLSRHLLQRTATLLIGYYPTLILSYRQFGIINTQSDIEQTLIYMFFRLILILSSKRLTSARNFSYGGQFL